MERERKDRSLWYMTVTGAQSSPEFQLEKDLEISSVSGRGLNHLA